MTMTVTMRMVVIVVMVMIVIMSMTMAMGATMVTSVRIIVKNLHDDEIANETKDTGDEHVEGFLNYLLFQHSFSSFNE